MKRPRAVDWRKLRHAYGSATDVPELLAGLVARTAQDRAAARTSLAGALVHQGTLYSASAAAVPAVLAALDGPDRAQVLELLGALAVGAFERCLAAGHVREDAYPALQRSHAAVTAGGPRLRELLADPDAEVRTRAAWLLGLLPDADGAPEALRALLAVEQVVAVRASAAIALGLQLGYRGDGASADEVQALRLAGPAWAQAAGALAQGYAAPLSPEVEAALQQAVRGGARARELPWNGGAVGEAARALLARRLEARPQAAAELLLEEARAGREPALRLAEGFALLQPARWRPPLLARELAPAALAFLRAAADIAVPGTGLAPYQARHDDDGQATLRRYLGLAPPGPYEVVVASAARDWPLWRWLLAWAAREIDDDALLAALAATTPATAVGAALLAAGYPHGVGAGGYAMQGALVGLLLRALVGHGIAAEAALVDAAARIAESHAAHWDGVLAAAALAALAAAGGRAPEERWDRLLTLPLRQGEGLPVAVLRATLALLPEPRRERLIAAADPWEGTSMCGTWRFWDLCVTAPVLRVLLKRVAGWARGKDAVRDRSALEALGRGVREVPGFAAEVEALAAGQGVVRKDLLLAALSTSTSTKKPKPKPKPKPKR